MEIPQYLFDGYIGAAPLTIQVQQIVLLLDQQDKERQFWEV